MPLHLILNQVQGLTRAGEEDPGHIIIIVRSIEMVTESEKRSDAQGIAPLYSNRWHEAHAEKSQDLGGL